MTESVGDQNADHTLEHSAFKVEKSGVDIEAKVDEIISGNEEVKRLLDKRTFWFTVATIIFMIILSSFSFFLFSLNGIAHSNREINRTNAAINAQTASIIQTLANATGQEAQDKQIQVVDDLIASFRKSLDCNTDYIKYNEVSDSCADVIARDEALRPPH